MTSPDDARTPGAPDVDQPEGGQHHGESEPAADGRTPNPPDQAEGDDDREV